MAWTTSTRTNGPRQIWQSARTDPAGLHAQMQQQWDERATGDDPFEQDPDTSNVSE